MSEKKLVWTNEKRKVNDLIPYEKNPRKLTEKQKEFLQKSLTKFNLMSIPTVNADNTIISGHQRVKILQLLGRGEETIDVRVPNRKLSESEMREANLLDNKTAELGEWDFDLLKDFSENELLSTGWDNSELDEIFGMELDDEFDAEKAFKEAVKNPHGVKTGDIWQLGEHRLIIGNAIDKSVWEKVLGNERFDLMLTDPPYRIGYGIGIRKQKTKKGTKLIRMREYKTVGKTTKDGKVIDIEKSKLNPTFGYKNNREYKGTEIGGGVPEYDEWLSIANEYQNPNGANVMIFENWKNIVDLWQAIEKYWKVKNMIIWHLPNRHQGFSAKYKFFSKYDIAPLAGEGVLNEEYEEELEEYLKEKGQKLLDTYEVILYGQKGKSEWDRKKGGKWSRITDHITHPYTTEGKSVIFGTKPIQILVPYLKTLSPRNGIVVEPFSGSGSTIIACEIMKRKCRAIEIEPSYAEVDLIRYEKFSGKKAEKIG